MMEEKEQFEGFNLEVISPRAKELRAFAQEYALLCSKYNFQISACGCCESPWVEEIEHTEKNIIFFANEVEHDNIVAKCEEMIKRGSWI